MYCPLYGFSFRRKPMIEFLQETAMQSPERASMRLSPYMERAEWSEETAFLLPRVWQTDCGVTAQIHYKEKALRTRTADIKSCAGYTVASAQGVGGNRGLAVSHSWCAVRWCQRPTGSPSPSDGITDANTVSRHATPQSVFAVLFKINAGVSFILGQDK